MPSGPIDPGHRQGLLSPPVAWLTIGLVLLAAAIDRPDTVRRDVDVPGVGVRPPPRATDADVREMLSHD
jgi:hypothetical protein